MIPSSAELHALYVTQGMSARAIAVRYGVAHITVLRWMKRSEIPRRPTGSGLAHRGQDAPTRAALERLIYEDRLTYREVGDRYGVDQSAIPQWLDRLGIARPTRTRIDPAAVLALYNAGCSASIIAGDLGCSKTTVLNFLRRMNVDRRDDGWGRLRRAKDGTMVRSTYEVRVADWLHVHEVAYEYEPRVPFGHGNTRADFLANDWYIEVWGVHSVASYKLQRERKCESYRALRLPLIELAPHHFARGGHLFERRMASCLQVAKRNADEFLDFRLVGLQGRD